MPNIVGLKDAAGNPARDGRVHGRAPSDFEVYSGDDKITLPLLALSAPSGSSRSRRTGSGARWVRWSRRSRRATLETARRVNAGLIPSYDYEIGDDAPQPIPTKTLLRVLGLRVGDCPPPMGPAPAGLADRARRVLEGLD